MDGNGRDLRDFERSLRARNRSVRTIENHRPGLAYGVAEREEQCPIARETAFPRKTGRVSHPLGVRFSRPAMGIVAVGMLAACGSSASAGHPAQARSTMGAAPVAPPVGVTSAGASPPSAAEVTAHLLKVKDLPSSWSEEPVRGPRPTDTRICSSGSPPQAETERIAIFDGASGSGQIAENLYGLASPGDAAAAYAFEIAHATCTTFSVPDTGITVTLSPLSYPAEGQQSTAWRATFTDTRTLTTESGVVVLLQEGSYDLGLIDRAVTGVDTDLLQTTVQKALADLA